MTVRPGDIVMWVNSPDGLDLLPAIVIRMSPGGGLDLEVFGIDDSYKFRDSVQPGTMFMQYVERPER